MSDKCTTVSLLKPSYLSNGKESKRDSKREHEEETREERRARKKKSRWGGTEIDKTFIPGMPTILPNNLSKNQEKAYLLQLQIEEISRKLRTGDLGISANPEERSPSPEPIYSSDGKRLNTREYRTRKNLEEERHRLINQMMSINTDYKPPADYKPPVVRVSDKVMIPQEEHPDINFVGLLIGPRGNTLKAMERETGAKIIIRGKGSVKEGKVGRKDGQPLPGEDEPLHAYVTANNPESVKKAVDQIKEIIRQGVEVPEGQNDLRRMQLRELALLNGTLRENEGPRCSNCGASTHKSWQCPDKPNITNSVVCSNCGGAGHIARDCRQKMQRDEMGPSSGGNGGGNSGSGGGGGGGGDRAKIDEEYMSLMAELGEGPPPPKNNGGDRRDNYNRRSVSLFDRTISPRAIMGVERHDSNNSLAPPGVIPASLPPPPWSNQPAPMKQQPPSLMSMPPVPNMGQMNQMNQMNMNQMNQMNQMSQMNQMNHMNQMNQPPPWQMSTTGVPPPSLMQPPPPPPGSNNSMPWMQPVQPPQQGLPPWQQNSPGPVPPPSRAAPPPPPPGVYPWQQAYPPPPQPVQPPQQGMDVNTLAGIPNLLSAPPPPPPS